MRLTNPFHWKHFPKLIAVPLVLVAISLILIFVYPKVTYGLDFKGGTLLTVSTTAQNPDIALIKTKLASFSSSVDVRPFTSPDGTGGLEIELGPSESLDKATATVSDLDTAKASFDSASVSLTSMQAAFDSGQGGVTTGQITDQQSKVDNLKASVSTLSATLMSELGISTALPADPSQAYQTARDLYSDKQQSYQTEILNAVKTVIPVTTYSAREVGSTLSKFFLNQIVQVLVISFLLSSLTVLVIFRSWLPSVAVVFGAVSDIIITLGVMAAIGFPLTLASFAALLMLIGFSFDTDVLLTVRVLKRNDGTPEERAFEAFKIAMMINFATLISFAVLLLTSLYLQISTYYEIAMVAVIGAVVDFIATWCGNAVIVLHFVKRK